MKDRVCKKSGLGCVGLVLLLLTVLPGCSDWFKKKTDADMGTVQGENNGVSSDDTSAVLVTMGGKPIITVDVFQKEFDDFVDKNRLRPLIQFMPDAKDKFLDGLISQYVIDQEIKSQGIDRQEKYKQEMNQIIKSAHQMLNTKYFAEMYPVKISDAEMKQFYDENKEKLPDILISRGGVNALGINFAKDSEAQAFFEKVKDNPSQFAQMAKEAQLGGKVQSFDLVSEQSPGIDPAVREKLVLYDRFPKVEIIKVNDKSCWVVYAKEKKKAECRPFEQVKATVEQYVMREKRMQVLEKEIAKLRDKYAVAVDKAPLQSNGQQQMPAMPMAGPESEGRAKKPASATRAA